MMKSEFESREAFECIFGDEGEIDLSKDETGEYSFQPSRFAYSFFLAAWQYRQTEVGELQYKAKLRESDHQALLVKYRATKKCWEDMSKEKDELQKRVDAALKVVQSMRNEVKHGHLSDDESQTLSSYANDLEQALKGGFE